MLKKRVGSFTVTVSDSDPYWTDIEIADKSIRFPDIDLDDLEYIISQVKKYIIARGQFSGCLVKTGS